MQQRTRRLAILMGGTLLATVGVLAACSTDNGNTPLPGTGTDSGRDTSKTDGSSSGNENGEDGSTSNDAGTDPDCALAPKNRSNDKGGFFCSFFTRDGGAGDAGGKSNCADDEVCCNPGKGGDGKFPASYCAKKGAGTSAEQECAAQATGNGTTWIAAGSSTWECGDKNNCPGSQVCCLTTWADAGPNDKVNIGKSLDKDIPAACGALQAFKQGGTKCADSCAADQIQLCSQSDDNCTGNQKCTPFSALFRDLSYCK